jgi:hypothetical protein
VITEALNRKIATAATTERIAPGPTIEPTTGVSRIQA